MTNSTSTDDNTTTNKGVNVRSETFPVRVHLSHEFESSSSNVATNRSITDIRNEIQNVLDLMGPTTPNVSSLFNQSSDADNESSTASVAHNKRRRSRLSSEWNQTNTTETSADKVPQSVVADVGTYSLTNFDNGEESELSCCEHHHHYHPPECLCVMDYMAQIVPPRTRPCEAYSTKTPKTVCKKPSIMEWIKHRSYDLMLKRSNPTYKPGDLYKINICGQQNDNPPKRVIFDLIQGIPKPTCSTVATNTIRNPVEKCKTNKTPINCNCKDMKNVTNETITHEQKKVYYDSEGNARVDYYYFDHGNSHYFHTTDTPPVMKCEIIAEKTERYTTKFWAEFFASVHIAVAFCISFILQLFKFLLYSILRPLTVGLMQLGSDYLIKPFLTTCFNGIIQPVLIFFFNIATSVRDLCDPIAEALGFFCRELAVMLRAVRLCTYKKNTNEETSNCDCKKKDKCDC